MPEEKKGRGETGDQMEDCGISWREKEGGGRGGGGTVTSARACAEW